MKPVDIKQDLAGNSYPGRGIVMGQSADGKQAVIAYFIMGRSVNSRNRVFVEEPDGIRTEAFDPVQNGPTPASSSTTRCGRWAGGIIVTNGDQTDTIRDFLDKGLTFAAGPAHPGVRARRPQLDPPHLRAAQPRRQLSSCPSSRPPTATAACCLRSVLRVRRPTPGQGHFIHTYKCDGDPLPSFEGEPKPVALSTATSTPLPTGLWDSLNAGQQGLPVCALPSTWPPAPPTPRIVNKNQ